jgi:hypothetical protein
MWINISLKPEIGQTCFIDNHVGGDVHDTASYPVLEVDDRTC